MLEYLNEIEAQLLLWLPTITSIVSIIAAAVGMFVKIRQSVKLNRLNNDSTNKKIEELETKIDNFDSKMTAVIQENIHLKQKLNKTLTKLDHVYREENED